MVEVWFLALTVEPIEGFRVVTPHPLNFAVKLTYFNLNNRHYSRLLLS